MTEYKQLTYEQRCQIEAYMKTGFSQQIQGQPPFQASKTEGLARKATWYPWSNIQRPDLGASPQTPFLAAGRECKATHPLRPIKSRSRNLSSTSGNPVRKAQLAVNQAVPVRHSVSASDPPKPLSLGEQF
jgi:hypothetical protein